MVEKARALTETAGSALQDAWIRDNLHHLTLEQKVGQMVVAGFPGAMLTPEVAEMVRRGHLGGVMLGGTNIKTPAQVAALVHDLQRLSVSDVGLPLFVCVDQEGGVVSRLGPLATSMPSAMALGATRSADYAYACALATARELRALGVNVNFAPVLDVNSEPANPVIGTRSFGDSPSLVAEMGVAVIAGFRDGDILATAKHFPGHGGSEVDSHLDLPVIRHSRRLLDSVDLVPFREAIAHGIDMIMTAHAVYPALANDRLLATVSHQILTDLLRRQMGFEGLVITDALVMQAIAGRYSLAEAAVLSIKAGVDVVLVLGTLDEQVQVCDEILRAVKEGEVSETVVEDSVARILGAKFGLTSCSVFDERVGSDFAHWPLKDHQKIADEVARRSITLVKDDDRLLPLHLQGGERLGLVEFAPASFSPVEGAACSDGCLRQLVAERHGSFDYLCLDVAPQGAEAVLASFVEGVDVVVVVTRNAHLIEEQAAMVRRILEHGKPVVILAARNPYDLVSFPAASVYVASYGDCPASLKAAVAVLFGDDEPQGKLPVAVPDLFPCGWGLEGFR